MARAREHRAQPPLPGQPARVEHEYERRGALCYLTTWDVHRAKLFDRWEGRSGIEPFDRLVEQVMLEAPSRCAERVFLMVDNRSSHRGQKSIERLAGRRPKLPNLASLERALLAFGRYDAEIAEPFEWRFTRADLSRLLARIGAEQLALERLAA